MARQGAQAPTGVAARRPTASRRPAGRGRASLALLLLPVALLLLPTTLVLLIGLLPALAARLVDRTPGRALTATVAMPNVCGALPGLAELWSRGHSLAQAQAVLADPVLWLLAYGAAGLGWAIFLLLPGLLRSYYALTTEGRIQALRRRQERLREGWGPEVAGTAAAAEVEPPLPEDGDDG